MGELLRRHTVALLVFIATSCASEASPIVDANSLLAETQAYVDSAIPHDGKEEEDGWVDVTSRDKDACAADEWAGDSIGCGLICCEPYYYVVAGNDVCAVGFYFDHDCGYINQEQIVITERKDCKVFESTEACYMSQDSEDRLRVLLDDMIEEVTTHGVHPQGGGVPPPCDIGTSPVLSSIYACEPDAISTTVDVVGPATGILVCELLRYCAGYDRGECSASPRE